MGISGRIIRGLRGALDGFFSWVDFLSGWGVVYHLPWGREGKGGGGGHDSAL